MVRTKEELLSSLRTVFGDNNDDNTIAIFEDVSDTIDSFNDGKDWKAEADRIDKEWRQKYHDRFFTSAPADDEDPLDAGNPEPKPLTFEALFS